MKHWGSWNTVNTRVEKWSLKWRKTRRSEIANFNLRSNAINRRTTREIGFFGRKRSIFNAARFLAEREAFETKTINLSTKVDKLPSLNMGRRFT